MTWQPVQGGTELVLIMASVAQTLPRSSSRFAWFGAFLRDELAPYRGRTALVARMVTASTLVVILGMTFRIPSMAFAALYTLFISRESLQATVQSARILVEAVTVAAAYVLVGSLLFLDSPMLRFLWVAATLFLVFYAVSASKTYIAAVVFGYGTVANIPLLDSHIAGEAKIEGILWAVGAIPIASVVTVLTEAAFAAFRRADYLGEAIDERLGAMEELLTAYAERNEAPGGSAKHYPAARYRWGPPDYSGLCGEPLTARTAKNRWERWCR